jgi:predicted nucleotidyltransferase
MADPIAVPPVLDSKREALADLCRTFSVRRLELFGSAAAGRFVEGQSDFDFLVTFEDDRVKGVARLYLGLAEGLEQLLGRPVDLVTPESIRNPYFRQAVDATRRLIYEA